MKKLFTFYLLMAVALLSCNRNNVSPQPDNQKRLIGTAKFSNNYTIHLFTTVDSLRIGYVPLLAQLLDDKGHAVAGASVHYSLRMKMHGGITHAAPAEPSTSYLSDDNTYRGGGVFFTMASTVEDSWAILVDVNLNGSNMQAEVPVWVAAHKTISAGVSTRLLNSFTGTDNLKYYIALVHPNMHEYKTGVQELDVAIFYMKNMMEFPAAENLSLSFVPVMPSMHNHSSPNNVNPVFYAGAHYRGKVSFTMSGDWRLLFSIKKGSELLAKDVPLDIYFQ